MTQIRRITMFPIAGAEKKTAEEWIAALGHNGERLDPEKSLRQEDSKPGVYRLGL